MSDIIEPDDLINATIIGVTAKCTQCETIITELHIEFADNREIGIHAARGGELVIRREYL